MASGGDLMMVQPFFVNRLPRLAELTPPVCLDPAMLRTTLRNLEAQLNMAAAGLAMREMSLAQAADVQFTTLLVGFLRAADDFFRYAAERIPQLRQMVQMALQLVGTGSPSGAGQLLFQCQNAERIRSNLRLMDRRLETLGRLIAQMEAAYRPDADRIAQGVQRRLTPPQIPMEEGGISLPRDRTIAEQMALASVRLFQREVAALLLLVQAALHEIVLSNLLRRLPNGLIASQ